MCNDEMAGVQKGALLVSERLTQHDIAGRIGGSREMVNRIVKDLTAGGYISVDAKQITVHKKLARQSIALDRGSPGRSNGVFWSCTPIKNPNCTSTVNRRRMQSIRSPL